MDYLQTRGIKAIDRSAFGQTSFEEDFLATIREKTNGRGVSIFIDNIGANYLRTVGIALAIEFYPPSQVRTLAATLAVIDAIPAGASLQAAQGWVMFRLVHPNDPGATDFGSFATRFGDVASHLSAKATPLDVVASMDPGADYAPYLLLAQTNGYRLMRQDSVVYSPTEREELIHGLGATCQDRGGAAQRQ